MPVFRKLKKERTRVTIEKRDGKLVKVTTIMRRKARDREEIVTAYNPLPDLVPIPSIWRNIL